jgi:hypothetical protein
MCERIIIHSLLEVASQITWCYRPDEEQELGTDGEGNHCEYADYASQPEQSLAWFDADKGSPEAILVLLHRIAHSLCALQLVDKNNLRLKFQLSIDEGKV